MTISRVCILAFVVIVLGAWFVPGVATEAYAKRLAASGSEVLTGELVITNAAKNRFRLVGHSGSFTAPPGTQVEAFDGKPVRVELARGRVLMIAEIPIYIEPITHGLEVVSGQLLVSDPVTRTFTLTGDDHVYVAPPAIDIRPCAGGMVNVRLDERGRVMGIDLAAPRGGATFAGTCVYRGQNYSQGESVCESGTQYRCESGTWRSFGPTCASDGATLPPWPQDCLLDDARVASGSSICRDGTTFRCVDGHWMNVRTACG